MDLLLPMMVFGVVFLGAMMMVTRRSARAVTRFDHPSVAIGGAAVAAAPRARTPILADVRKTGVAGKIATKVSSRALRDNAAKLLLQAGNPMPVGTFLLLRCLLTFVMTPLAVLYFYRLYGLSVFGVVLMAMAALTGPKMAMIYVKRKARKRAKEVEQAMPDALDLLVVCVEGGMSLDGGIQQVAQRTEGLLATEFQRLLSEVSTGMPRREALQGLAARSTSQSLGALSTTIIQSDKMGVSIATSLRTLAETLRTKRRQAAETQARKAPIKMLPFIVIFMLPGLFIVILGPTIIAMIEFFRNPGM